MMLEFYGEEFTWRTFESSSIVRHPIYGISFLKGPIGEIKLKCIKDPEHFLWQHIGKDSLIASFHEYLSRLTYWDTPDYTYLRTLLQDALDSQLQ